MRFAMVPVGAGPASGELLVVLETEIPRIGAASPTTQVRKRYYVYPGNDTHDEVSEAMLQTLTRKPFRFSRALHTTAHFKIGKLLRPLAANVYVYDRNKVLVRHERRAIESEE